MWRRWSTARNSILASGMTKTRKSGTPKQAKGRARGKPFEPGDPRINREGVSKKKADLKEFVRGIAQAVLEAPSAESQRTELQLILEAARDKAKAGSLEHAEFLLTWAYGKPPQEMEVTGAGGGPIVIDIGSAVARRAQKEA